MSILTNLQQLGNLLKIGHKIGEGIVFFFYQIIGLLVEQNMFL